MTKEELIKRLKELPKSCDTETAHLNADNLLILYINDADIMEAYHAINKWYA